MRRAKSLPLIGQKLTTEKATTVEVGFGMQVIGNPTFQGLRPTQQELQARR